MMTGRERVMTALNFQETDRVPMDLGGMLSTGISCFAYPALIEALGLPPRRPRVHDTSQMLALPEPDVLDALDCDVVTVMMDGVTNGFDQPELWHEYDFGGRLPALVRDPDAFEERSDGTILQPLYKLKMPPAAHVFEQEHGGQPVTLEGDVPKPDIDAVAEQIASWRLTDETIAQVTDTCRRVRENTDRAILLNGPWTGIAIGAHGGLGVFPMLCVMEPDFVAELHEMNARNAVEQTRRLVPEVAPFIDVYLSHGDDWGTQNSTIAAPQVFRDLFRPYIKRVNNAVHECAPDVKTFLHSCGAIYDILEDLIECGFDILNPVQWTAGGHSFREWKDVCRGRMALWGGGVDTQATLPLGSVDEVAAEVREIVTYLKEDGGFVFNSIHNILAEIPAEKILTLYHTAKSV